MEDEESWDEFFDNPERRQIVGELIEKVIALEYFISNLINTYFVKGFKKQIQFKEFILDKEFFTFNQKINILGRLRKNNLIFLSDKTYTNLIEIMNIRNSLAHQLRSFDLIEGKKKFKIWYKNHDKVIERIFDDEFSQEVKSKINEAIKELQKILENLEKLDRE